MTTPTATATDLRISPEMSAYIDLVAKRAAREAIAEAIGVDLDSYESLREHHADQIWTRSARKGSSEIRGKITTTFIGVMITGICYAIWSAIQRASGGQ